MYFSSKSFQGQTSVTNLEARPSGSQLCTIFSKESLLNYRLLSNTKHFQHVSEKLRCILNYFSRVIDKGMIYTVASI